jgi:hypothetical protein
MKDPITSENQHKSNEQCSMFTSRRESGKNSNENEWNRKDRAIPLSKLMTQLDETLELSILGDSKLYK